MADDEFFKVTGLEEAFRELEQLPVRLEKNILRGAIRAGAKPVADDARRRAPVLQEADPRRVAGALAKSVRILAVGVKNGVVKGGVAAGGAVKVGRGKAGKAADAFYAWFVEKGTHKMAPRPFLRPAADTQTPAAIDATVTYIRGRVEAGDLKR